MAKPTLLLHPSLESGTTAGELTPVRHSLFETKDAFIERIAPVGVAAIYFGSFTLAPQDAPLSRQALFKLSFLYRHFLQPAGLLIVVQRQTAVLSGTLTSRPLATMAHILALEIEGIRNVEDNTLIAPDLSVLAPAQRDLEVMRQAVQFLFATDQTLRSGVQVSISEGQLVLQGQVNSIAQKNWAEQLAEGSGAQVLSQLKVSESVTLPTVQSEPPLLDDESQQAIILFRLRLVRETEHINIKVRALRGIVSLQGRVRTEALRQCVENIVRSTLGLRELRSSLTIAA